MVGKFSKGVLIVALGFIFMALIGGTSFKNGFNDGLEDAAKPTYKWLIEEKTTDDIRVVKAEIGDNLTNKLILDGCYIDIHKYIKNENLDGINELQYWAVDSNGQKCVSFVINGSVLEQIKSGALLSKQVQDNIDDLWITPTLR